MLIKRIAWLTDIHLNFLEPQEVETFCRNIVDRGTDAMLLGGDTGVAPSIRAYLRILENELRRPIYFVLGNHDFYHGSIARVRKEIKEISDNSRRLHWLPATGAVELTPETGLIGIDSWADGRFGDYEKSEVMLNDYLYIEEFVGLDRCARLKKLNQLGDEAAAALNDTLPAALERFSHTILLTHVPPFEAACWHEGRLTDKNWLPHFSCKAVGEALFELMCSYPHRKLTVLCGHTHSPGSAQILPNLIVKTGVALYGRPNIQELLIVK